MESIGEKQAISSQCDTVALVMFVLLFLALVQVFYLQNNKYKAKHKAKKVLGLEDIPGPRSILGIKLIGNLLQLLPYTNTLDQMLKWAETYPEILKTSCFGLPTCVSLVSPHVIQQLFRSSDFGHCVKASTVYDIMKPFIQNGLLVSRGNEWKQNRKILMQTQNLQNLKAYMPLLSKQGQQFVHELEQTFEDGKPKPIKILINTLFLKITSEMISGSQTSSSEELHRYHYNFQLWKECFTRRLLHPWLLLNFVWKLHPMSKRLDKAIQEMFDFAERIIAHYKANAASNHTKQNQHTSKETFRSLLDELLDPNECMPHNQVVDEVNTMFFGGHETGATALHFFCYMMAFHPQIQKLCQLEIDELFETPEYINTGLISYNAATSGLKYIERCIQETMRLYPPVFLIFRQLEASLSMDTDKNTYVLPSGCIVAVCSYVVHRNSKYYPNPEKFDPNRFLPGEVAKRPSCSYIPFSGGSRVCLAPKFAMIELKVLSAYLLRNFTIGTTAKLEDVKLLPFITLTPQTDFEFTFTKRNEFTNL